MVSPAEPEICCGSAGIYNLVAAGPAADLGDRKASHLAALCSGYDRHRQSGLHAAESPRPRGVSGIIGRFFTQSN
jgi:hypothetical protein